VIDACQRLPEKKWKYPADASLLDKLGRKPNDQKDWALTHTAAFWGRSRLMNVCLL